MKRARLFLPLAVFLVVVVVGYVGFSLKDPHILPSALLNKPFPEFREPLLGTEKTVGREDLVGTPVLVNVWATWCPTCAAEHGELLEIQKHTGLRIVGINYKDDPVAAQKWLDDYGNPYDMVIEDPDGTLGVNLGVYGAPESFLVNAAGTIVYKRVGDINPRVWREEMEPVVKDLLGG